MVDTFIYENEIKKVKYPQDCQRSRFIFVFKNLFSYEVQSMVLYLLL